MHLIRKLITLMLLSLSIVQIHAQVIVRDTSAFERVTHFMRIDKTYCSGMHTVEAIFPYMQTNHYQVVENPVVFSNGQVRDNAEGGNKYIGYGLYMSELNSIGNIFDIGMSFDVATININVNFDAITTIYPYDTSSKEYIENTGNITTCVLPHHPHIESVANEIWSQSTDIIDYARRCYEYTATHLNYLNANSGIHSLQSIIDAGGGDCGNFSSYYISLLRNRDIPSRHVVAVMGQDNYHVWAEFYLQNYGWIPVDPTFRHGNPNEDFFGHKNSPYYITTLGLELTNYRFTANSTPMQLELMQLLYYGWWCYDPCTSSEFNFMIRRSKTSMISCSSADESMGEVKGGGRCSVDSVAVLTAIAKEGYRFVGWRITYLGYDKTVTSNPLSLTPTNDMTVVAQFEHDGTDIRNPYEDSKTIINTQGLCINVNVSRGEKVQIYDLTGRLIDSGNKESFIVPVEGIYFVKVGSRSAQKVVIEK